MLQDLIQRIQKAFDVLFKLICRQKISKKKTDTTQDFTRHWFCSASAAALNFFVFMISIFKKKHLSGVQWNREVGRRFQYRADAHPSMLGLKDL